MTIASVRRSIETNDNRPIVIDRESADRVRSLITRSALSASISEAGQHAYIVRDGETVVDVYGSIAAHGGMLAPESVTRDEWIQDGLAAVDRHTITIDADLALRKIERTVVTHTAHAVPGAENAFVL